MRYLIILLLFILPSFAKPLITQYYQDIYKDRSVNHNLLTYKIYQKKQKWYAKEMVYADARAVPITVNLKQNLIKIVAETGDGHEVVEILRWKQKNGVTVVSIMQNLYSGNYPASGKITFLEKEGKKWYKSRRFSNIELSDFLNEDAPLKALKVLKNIGAVIHYKVSLGSQILQVMLHIDNSVASEDYLYYDKHLKKKLKHKISLKWDFQKGKFKKIMLNKHNNDYKQEQKKLYQKIQDKREELLERYYNE